MIPAVDVEVFAKLYDAGLSSKAIGEKFGVTGQFVRRRMERAGFARRKCGGAKGVRQLDSKSVDLMIAMHKNGASTQQIAHKFGIDRHTVRVRLNAVGIRIVRKGDDPALVRRVVEAYAVEKSTPVVARKLGMNSWVVRRILQQAGVEFDGGGWIVRRLNAPELPKPESPKVPKPQSLPKLSRRKPATVNTEVIERVITAHRERPNVSDVAPIVGVSVPTAYKILKAAGIVFARRDRRPLAPIVVPPSEPEKRSEFDCAVEILKSALTSGPADAGDVALEILLAGCAMQYRAGATHLELRRGTTKNFERG